MGNRDGLKFGGVWDLLNRRWVWIIFDAFWVSFAGLCVYTVTYFIMAMSKIYNSNLMASIASEITCPFAALGKLLLAGATLVPRVIAGYASYFDWVPFIKDIFSNIGDWLNDMAIWINVYMHRKYNIPRIRALAAPSHWTSDLSYTPFALLNVLCFGSEPVSEPGPAEVFPVPPGVHSSTRPVFEELIPTLPEWHWDEVPNLALRKVILPIAYDGVWDGFLFSVHKLRLGYDFIHAAFLKVWRRTFGKVGLLASGAAIAYLTYDLREVRDLIKQIVRHGGAGLLITGLCVVVTFVSISVFNILKGSWDTVFSRKPFSQLTPSTPGFYSTISSIFFSQVLVIALIYGFNIIACSMSIPLTLSYTTFILYAMASDILEIWSDKIQLGITDTTGRVLALARYYFGGWVPAPWFWTPYHFAAKPFFHWSRGLATTFIYDGLSFSMTSDIFTDFCIGSILLLNSLRIPGCKYILSQCSVETQAVLLCSTAAITTFQTHVLECVVLIEVFFAFTKPQLAILYALLWGAYLWDPKLPYPSPNDNPSINKEMASSALLSLQTTLRRTIRIFTLIVAVQLSDDPYVENEWTEWLSLISSWDSLVAGVFFITHALVLFGPSNPTIRRVYRTGKQYFAFIKLQQFDNLLQNARHSLGNRFKNQWLLYMECIAQIGVLFFNIYALTFLPFNLAFYSLAILGLLLFFYY
ncbi:hypothetical protein IFR05_010887 [Cadophora sp. M221]|nr:hypothetical protein IFR05_010887 [Cadophora sp. M221]